MAQLDSISGPYRPKRGQHPAAGPNPILDADIAEVLGITVWHFTEKVDDALSLVPKGCFWLIGKGVTRPDEPLYGARVLLGSEVVSEGEHDANPALALCIAALKARTTQPLI